MKYNIIVAMCKYNSGIGFNGSLPWDIKEDLLYFSKLTKGTGKNAVIMGSTTYKSLNKPGLPRRDNFILSSSLDLNFSLKNSKEANTNYVVKTFSNINTLLDTCSANNYDTVWVIGGTTIYKQFLDMNLIENCYVTLIHKLFECDTTFPFITINDWDIVAKQDLIHKYDFKIEFIEYAIPKLRALK